MLFYTAVVAYPVLNVDNSDHSANFVDNSSQIFWTDSINNRVKDSFNITFLRASNYSVCSCENIDITDANSGVVHASKDVYVQNAMYAMITQTTHASVSGTRNFVSGVSIHVGSEATNRQRPTKPFTLGKSISGPFGVAIGHTISSNLMSSGTDDADVVFTDGSMWNHGNGNVVVGLFQNTPLFEERLPNWCAS